MNEALELSNQVPASDIAALCRVKGWTTWQASQMGFNIRNLCECRCCERVYQMRRDYNYRGCCSRRCYLKVS